MSSSTMPLAHGAPALSNGVALGNETGGVAGGGVAAGGAQLVLLRDLLEAHRSFRCDQLDQLRRAALLPGRTATDREINESLANGARAALREIMQALRRMDDGSYGSCVHCFELLPIERLEVLPQAALCMTCQHLVDRAAGSA
jgi:DnaK suppressor protein